MVSLDFLFVGIVEAAQLQLRVDRLMNSDPANFYNPETTAKVFLLNASYQLLGECTNRVDGCFVVRAQNHDSCSRLGWETQNVAKI